MTSDEIYLRAVESAAVESLELVAPQVVERVRFLLASAHSPTQIERIARNSGASVFLSSMIATAAIRLEREMRGHGITGRVEG